MTKPPFEVYALVRVTRLRETAAALLAEADALDKALGAYNAVAEGDASPAPAAHSGGLARPQKQFSMKPGQGKSQGAMILELLQGAGVEGMALPEMYKHLAEKGVTNTGSIRSVIWNMKKDGKVVARDDRYVAANMNLL